MYASRFLALVVTVTSFAPVYALNIETVPVGNPGNANDTRYIDPQHPSGVGSVGYPFSVAKTEVTNAQYVDFLNAVAAADSYGLYSTFMDTETWGGIVRSGAAGSYTYSVKPPALSGSYTYGNKPVVYVSSGDAMRFVNWLHNGQPTGAQDATTTEDGTYTLNGATTNAALTAVTRNAAARWWLPNENEWYKSAYHKNDGVTGNYWDYPTGTNTAPNNNPPSSDTGNSANFSSTGAIVSYPLTDTGAYTLSDSPYGTFDQGGNVMEWNETLFSGPARGLRGGAWSTIIANLRAQNWHSSSATAENFFYGFRVASVPEPSSALLAVSIFALLASRRARR